MACTVLSLLTSHTTSSPLSHSPFAAEPVFVVPEEWLIQGAGGLTVKSRWPPPRSHN